MTWSIRTPNGAEVLNSTDDLGVYLLDVITVGGNFESASYQVPAATRGSTTDYDYSMEATRIWPVVIPFKVWNYGWRPVLENWTGPTDTTFTVAWRQLGGSNVGDSGYVVYVFGAGSPTTTGTYMSWMTDDGTNEYLSADRAPMRYLSSETITRNTGYDNPTQNGVAFLPEFALPIQQASTTAFAFVPNRFTNVSTEPWFAWPRSGSNTNTVHWFTSRWPRTDNMGSPHMVMRDPGNRVFFDSRERYMRVLDIQVVDNTPNGVNGHTNSGTTVVTFSDDVPTDTSWGFFSNIGGINPSFSSTGGAVTVNGRSLVLANENSVLPSPIIAIAVDLTGL